MGVLLPLRSFTCLRPGFAVCGNVRQDLVSPVLDPALCGMTLSLQFCVQFRRAFSVCGCSWFGALLLALNFGLSGLLLPFQLHARSEAGAAAFGLMHSGLSPSISESIYQGSLPFPRTSAHPGVSVSILGLARSVFLPVVLDLACYSSTLTTRASGCLGIVFAVFGVAHSDLTFLVLGFADLGPLLSPHNIAQSDSSYLPAPEVRHWYPGVLVLDFWCLPWTSKW